METPQLRALRTELQARKAKRAADQEKIEKLEKKIRESAPSGTLGDDEEQEDEESGDEDNEVEANWDSDDNIYRCPDCQWEVIESMCQACAREFKWDDEQEDSFPSDSLEENAAIHEDRTSSCRSATPLDDIGPFRPLPAYSRREKEYEALLRRGATRLMIETFNLEYTFEKGIFAWADGELYNQFAGPKMRKGDFWKIQLGRRFNVDEDDLDGSIFIEGLLEDALLFPAKQAWETVEEYPGIWLTRLIPMQDVDDNDKGSDSDSASDSSMYDDKFDDDRACHDRALANPPPVDGPILLSPGYETSDEEEEALVKVEDGELQVIGSDGPEDIEMDTDSGWAIEANVPDQPWGSESEMTDVGDAVAEAEAAAAEVDLQAEPVGDDDVDTLDPDSDEADSDFDSNEDLSGDEDLSQQAAILMGYPQPVYLT
ncbi:hypothetical protein Hypma_000466 [Hypsizygus marmoreus]|uniref:DUF8191 domain-containing protein n=1 Tax=Hypsizygus marmoreus TaxID=39966 RepID=A0A369JHC0_HYPMA|nr:hypothetical protein Hypma_000466 [Hypsizygus marmoreus]